VTYDNRLTDRLNLRARYEYGDRSIDGYDVEAAEASFVEPEGVTLPADLRRFDEAERNYGEYNVQAQWFATDAWNFTFGVTGRDEDYDKSKLGLLSDDIFTRPWPSWGTRSTTGTRWASATSGRTTPSTASSCRTCRTTCRVRCS